MTKLEGLLRDADDRRVRLETRVADAQRLEWALRQRIEELERRLRDIGQPPPPAAPQIQQQTAPEGQPVRARQEQQRSEVHRVDGDDFAAVLHQSILREEARDAAAPAAPARPAQTHAAPAPQRGVQPPMQPVPLSPQQQAEAYRQQMPPSSGARQQESALRAARMQTAPTQMAAAPAQSQPAPEAPPQEDEAIIKARALLRAGRTIEQVARETGVEIGALRLMQQMTARD